MIILFYIFQTTVGSHIEVKVVELSLENSLNCKNDYLLVQDVAVTTGSNGDICGVVPPTTSQPQVATLCGDVVDHTLTSLTNQLTVTFKTNKRYRAPGFKIWIKGSGI